MMMMMMMMMMMIRVVNELQRRRQAIWDSKRARGEEVNEREDHSWAIGLSSRSNSVATMKEIYKKMMIFHEMKDRMKQQEDSGSAASIERRRAMVMMMTRESIRTIHHASHQQKQKKQHQGHEQRLAATTMETFLWAMYRYD
eukprot:jgi/Bigna1/67532/fgenesh1_pg.4_\